MTSRDSTGREGEKRAGQFLKKQGFRILDERFRTKFGELDLVCRKDRLIVFVEVRSRADENSPPPVESVTPKKISRVVKSAQVWLNEKRLQGMPLRFDLITVDMSVSPARISHYPAAFEAGFDL